MAILTSLGSLGSCGTHESSQKRIKLWGSEKQNNQYNATRYTYQSTYRCDFIQLNDYPIYQPMYSISTKSFDKSEQGFRRTTAMILNP